MTTQQDFHIKKVIKEETPSVTLYQYLTAEEVKVPIDKAAEMLAKTTKRLKIVDGQVHEYGEVFHPFVKTKEECGNVVSNETKQIASVGEVKRKRQNRGKRGKRRR